MSQDVWSLKLDSDLKEKIQELVKNDFESSKEFMEHLINVYELDLLKQGNSVFAEEVSELEKLTRRINNIFINANERIGTMLQDKDNQANIMVNLKQDLVERLQAHINKVEKDLENVSAIADELTEANAKHMENLEQMVESNKTLNALVGEYKEKNDTLTGLLSEYKEDRAKKKELEEESQELKRQAAELTSQLNHFIQKHNIVETNIKAQEEKHQNEIQTMKEHHQNEVQGIKEQHIFEMGSLKKSLELDANVKCLQIKEDYQTRIQEIKSGHAQEVGEYQSKMKEIQDKYTQEIEQYQAKYKELLEKMEQEIQRQPKTNKKK